MSTDWCEKNKDSWSLFRGVAERLARPNILSLKPYKCARNDYSHGILLDANENAIGPISLPTKSLDPYNNHLSLERYPSPYQIPLKVEYSKFRGYRLKPDNIFVGVGSDEAIDILMRIFCKPNKDKIMITPPTYGMYQVSANVNDIGVVKVPLTPEFDLRVTEILAATAYNIKLLFICSPGNPTSKAIPLYDIEEIAKHFFHGIVVVDEAYVDFSSEVSAVSLLEKYSNLVVLQTLSKSFGLAGIRCGFALGSPDIIQLMNNIKSPYNINKLTEEVAINAIKNVQMFNKTVNILLNHRGLLAKALHDLDFVVKVFPSDSNFLLFKLKKKAKEVYKTMAMYGVVIRYRGSELYCDQCLRVTIGKENENNAFIELLKKVYAEHLSQ